MGLVKGWLGAGGTLWEKNRARRARLGQTDVYLQPPEGYKTNSGFNRFLRVAFHGSRVTSDGGLILVRELDERLGFGKLIEQHLTDTRAKNTRLPLTDLLRQSVYPAFPV